MATRVYVSHTDEDIVRCQPLLQALGVWQIPAYFDSTDRRSAQNLAKESQQTLVECDILLRVCTRFTNRSYWMSIEAGAFLSLQADDQRAGQPNRHRIVNLVLDLRYVPEPFDVNAANVEADASAGSGWVNDLRRALGLPPLDLPAPVAEAINPPARGVSRRAVVGWGAAGVVVLAAGAAGGIVWAQRAGAGSGGPQKPPSSDTRLRWWYDARDPSRATKDATVIVSGAAVADGVVYVATLQGQALALSAAVGHKLWTFDLDPTAAVYQNPVVANGIVYVSADQNGIFALRNGKQVWSKSGAPGVYTTPVIADGKLWVNGGDIYAFLDALDLATGADLLGLSPQPFTIPISGVAVMGTRLFCGGEDGYLYALDSTRPDNPVVWKADTGAKRDSAENKSNTYYATEVPVVANGVVYAGSTDFHLYAFDAQTGQQRWAFATQNEIIDTAPAVANGLVYVASQDKSLYAVDASTGKLRWRYQTGSAVISTPTVADGVVYLSSGDHAVYALDGATGAVRHIYRTASSVRAQPAIAGGSLYVSDARGVVYAFTAE